MPNREQPRAWQERYFWAIVIAVIVAGVVLLVLHFHLANETQKQMAASFGEALLIAGILAATVDQFVKFRVIREVMSDVWQYLANHRVPVEISDYLHDSLQATIIRRNLTLKYKFSKEPGRNMRADIEITYQIENYGNQEKVMDIFISEEEHKKPVFESISCISSDPQGVIPEGKPLNITSPVAGVKRAEVKDYEKIRVQPFHDGLFYNVIFKYHLDNVLDSDSDVLSFNGPTIDVTIEAAAPASLTFVPPATNLAGGGRWIYKRVFLKEQHLHVRWFPPKP